MFFQYIMDSDCSLNLKEDIHLSDLFFFQQLKNDGWFKA